MNKPADHQTRARALDTRQSFAVAAPAGSGKTGLLTQRILCLLAQVDEPEQILCMTFTRKAAAEMRHRLIDALVRAQHDDEPEDEYEKTNWKMARQVLARDKAQNWQLIAAPNRLRILTIDSFCRKLASQLVIESGFGELPEPVEHPDVYYRMAIHDLLSNVESNAPLGDALGELLIHLDNDMARLESLLLRMLAKREQWLPHILASQASRNHSAREDLEAAAKNLIEETLCEVTELLIGRASDIALLADYAAQNLLESSEVSVITECLGLNELPEARHEQVPLWLGLAELLLIKSGHWRKTINKKAGFPTKKDSVSPDIADARKAAWAELCQW
ncbi:MAG: DNA helicase UvrD, partial [Gammaproteobacteria bacterium]